MVRPNAMRRAFSLLELPQVVAIAVVLAVTFAVPWFLHFQEREKIARAYSFLNDIQRAQLEYREEHGLYAKDLSQLDLRHVSPAYYSVDPIVWKDDNWSVSLHRFKGDQTQFGDYTITFDASGLVNSRSSVPQTLKRNH